MKHSLSRRTLMASGVAVGIAGLSACIPDHETTELVVWQTETDPKAVAALGRVKAQFEKAHPGVILTIESIPWGSLSTRLNAAIQTGNLPDVAHIQPFMGYSLVQRGLLSPINDLMAELDTGGRIFDAVRHLQFFDGQYYGIAHAVGVTGWAFDMRKARGLQSPYPADDLSSITTDQFIQFVAAVKARSSNGVLLPGGSPFFIDQLVGELLSNAGGSLYDGATRSWLFTSPPMRRVMEFLLTLKTRGLLDPNWAAQTYPDQFPRLANDEGAFVTPVTYGRAAVSITKTLSADGKAAEANATAFPFMSPPLFANSMVSKPIATIDCEPFVVLADPAKRIFNGKPRRNLSIDFLRLFYRRDNYLAFTKTVPMHLTPIFKDVAADPEYLSSIGPWSEWHTHTLAYLNDENATRPILVPGHDPAQREADLKNPYLLDLSAQNIISNGVSRLLTESRPDVSNVLQEMQVRASRLIRT